MNKKLSLFVVAILLSAALFARVENQEASPPSYGYDTITSIGGSCDSSQWIYSRTTGAATNWHCSFTWAPGTWECTVQTNGSGSCLCVHGTGCD